MPAVVTDLRPDLDEPWEMGPFNAAHKEFQELAASGFSLPVSDAICNIRSHASELRVEARTDAADRIDSALDQLVAELRSAGPSNAPR